MTTPCDHEVLTVLAHVVLSELVADYPVCVCVCVCHIQGPGEFMDRRSHDTDGALEHDMTTALHRTLTTAHTHDRGLPHTTTHTLGQSTWAPRGSLTAAAQTVEPRAAGASPWVRGLERKRGLSASMTHGATTRGVHMSTVLAGTMGATSVSVADALAAEALLTRASVLNAQASVASEGGDVRTRRAVQSLLRRK